MAKFSDFIQTKLLGLLFCALVAYPATLLGTWLPVVGAPVFAILMGMVLALLWRQPQAMSPGIKYTSKKILQYAVILLGFGMNLQAVLRVGLTSLPIIFATISTSLIVAYVFYRLATIDSTIATLVGVGSSICGGSAVAATAPVIEARDEQIAQAISVIFLFNVIAVLIFPSLGMALGLSHQGFALFAGTAINDTSSVTAAASAWDGIHGTNTLEMATIVKLTRTLAIIPITLVLAYFYNRRQEWIGGFAADIPETDSVPATHQGARGTSRKTAHILKIFPTFILFFLLAACITTLFSLDPSITKAIRKLSKYFIVMAMFAIGLNTDIVKLVKTGLKPICLGFACWVSIASVSLGLQAILGIM